MLNADRRRFETIKIIFFALWSRSLKLARRDAWTIVHVDGQNNILFLKIETNVQPRIDGVILSRS